MSGPSGRRSVLVTGASGLVGQHVVAALRNDPERYDIVTVARRDLPGRAHLRHDLRTPIPEQLVDGPLDSIIHCAARVDEHDDDYAVIDDNLRMAFNVLGLARAKEVRSIVNVSSIAVYGLPTVDETITEDHELRPESAYGVSKALAEELLTVASADIAVTHLRLSYVLAPRMPDRYFLVRIAQRLRASADVEIVNPDSTRFSFVEVDDIARACEAALEHRSQGPFNMAADERPTPREVVCAIASRHPDSSSQLTFLERPEQRLTATFDSSRVKQLLAADRLGDPLDAIRASDL